MLAYLDFIEIIAFLWVLECKLVLTLESKNGPFTFFPETLGSATDVLLEKSMFSFFISATLHVLHLCDFLVPFQELTTLRFKESLRLAGSTQLDGLDKKKVMIMFQLYVMISNFRRLFGQVHCYVLLCPSPKRSVEGLFRTGMMVC